MNELIGKIEEIQETKKFNKKDGSGEISVTKIKINGKYFSCFYSQEDINKMSVGQEVEVKFIEKEYQGYINYNIISIQPIELNEVKEGNGTLVIGNKKYKLSVEEI